MSETLEHLFGSKERMRMLRFFLQNPEQEYEFSDIAKRNMLKSTKIRKELEMLKRIRFVAAHSRKGKITYSLNTGFVFYLELKSLISKDNIYPQSKNLSKVKNLGNIKLAAISGAFINYPKSRADMVLVGDGVSRARLKNLMRTLEAEIGKEIDFVLMSGEEFKYRLNMLDKFLLEFFQGPHEEIVNKISGFKRLIADRK